MRAAVLVIVAVGLAPTESAAQDTPLVSAQSLEERSGREILQRRIMETENALRRMRNTQKGGGPRDGGDEDGGLLQPKIVNGVLTGRHPTAGALLKAAGAILKGHCSGTLIGARTFLTAQHCVTRDDAPGNYRVYLQHAGIFEIASIIKHPDYSFPTADLAVIKLKEPVKDVRPAGVRTAVVPVGTDGLVVGYGRSGGDRYDYGLKRVGGVTTARCRTGYDNSKLICWDYRDPIGAPGAASNTCNSDSGGPLYVADGRRVMVAGVTSGGEVLSCLQGDHSYDVNVPLYSRWILDQLGKDTDASPSSPIVWEAGTTVRAEAGMLRGVGDAKSYSVALKPSTRTVRVAMHGHNDPYDEVRFGWLAELTPPGARKPQHCQPTTGQWGFCSFAADRKGGTLRVTATRIAGAGEFQVTVTELD